MATRKSLLTIEELSAQAIRSFLETAKSFKKVDPKNLPPLLSGKTIVNLFFENSTRTRTSFELATRRLGGGSITIAAATSSVQKGETLIDTAKNIEAMNPSCIVVRHSSAGSPLVLHRNVAVPVINAGDGFHEHPTQALLDTFTIEEKLGNVKGKRILILGDIAHSRVARSNIHLLKKLGASVSVCGPPTLLPPDPESMGIECGDRIEDFLPQADVVMTLRLQLERQNSMQLPSLAEYTHFWALNRERAGLLKPNVIIMHPGPINRGVELDPEVADGPLSVILDQVANGVLVRMSVLAHLCNDSGLAEWERKEDSHGTHQK